MKIKASFVLWIVHPWPCRSETVKHVGEPYCLHFQGLKPSKKPAEVDGKQVPPKRRGFLRTSRHHNPETTLSTFCSVCTFRVET
jgi:hypothetical protein